MPDFMPPYIVERLDAYKIKQAEMRKRNIELFKEKREIELEMDALATKMLIEAGLPDGVTVDEIGFNLEDGWDCPDNVIGKCVYDNQYESCIYCGEPDERK